MELEICTKTFWNFSKKLRGKCPLSTLCLSMASISCLVNAFLEILELKRSLVEGQQLQQKDRKKRKNEKPKLVGWFIVQKLSPNFDFCTCLSKKVFKFDSGEIMQGCVLCFKSCFDWFEAISADSKPPNVKNILKMGFFGKTPGVNGLRLFFCIIFTLTNFFCRTQEPSAFDYTEESIDDTSHITRKIPKTGKNKIVSVCKIYR